MSIHIRVYPQGTMGSAYGYGGAYGGTTTALYAQALQSQKSQDSLQLQYQNALWEEKLQNQQLTDQLQYQPAVLSAQLTGSLGAYGAYGAYANPYAGYGYGGIAGGFLGGLL